MATLKTKRKLPKLDTRPLAALDTETTGPDFFHGCRPFYVSTCDQDGKVRSWQWDVDPLTRTPYIPSHEIQDLQDFVDSHRLIFHNAKFDIRALHSIGIGINNIWTKDGKVGFEDTLVASHVIDNSMPHGLKYLCQFFLYIDIDDQKALRDAVTQARSAAKKLKWRIADEGDPHFPGLKFSSGTYKWCMDMWLPRAVAKHNDYKDHPWYTVCGTYGDMDSIRTISLHEKLQALLLEHDLYHLYVTRLQALQPLYYMEETGLTFHLPLCNNLIDQYDSEVDEHTSKAKRIVKSAGGYINNLASFKQLQVTLFNTLKVPHTSTTKTGFSTSKEELAKACLNMRPTSKGTKFINHLAAINQRKTAISYLESYKRFYSPYPQVPDNSIPEDLLQDLAILHPNINLTGTRTTRQSSNSPNGQNISKKEGFNLRSIFGPVPGRVWYSVDYANIELRILAYESEEPELIEAFQHDQSVHMMFARIVCPEAIRKAGGEDRFKKTQQYRYVKNGDFALTYGASAATADAAYHIKGAYRKVRRYFTKLDTYMRSIVSLAERRGYITTRSAVGEGYPLYTTPGKAYTQAVDYVCQGTAGWAMLLAIIQCWKYLAQYPTHHMIMTIHDELLFDFPADDERNMAILANCTHLMESSGAHINVPLKAEAEVITTTWDKGVPVHTDKYKPQTEAKRTKPRSKPRRRKVVS